MRYIDISGLVQKDFDQFDGREKQWIKAVIAYLKDENNSLDLIKQKFKPLGGELSGYYKAKHRGFGIRLIFQILNENELKVYFERIEFDADITEVIQIIAGGRRDKIYDKAAKRIKK
jgi:mRNA-degrading endonuclease RelE of RelBE toxin-antitoxin system